MCGIAGILGATPTERVVAMSDAMAHRGPDDAGLFVDRDAGIALAHRRLSIIDVSSSGHQPMGSASGRYQLVFNGEIYNYRELRQELAGLGQRFRSESDTEVVLAAYERWGEACVHRLRGMFAFAIYDAQRRELFIARDRLGIKPLYFTSTDGTFAFASELKGLLESGLVERRLDLDAVWYYLSFGSMPQPRTALRDVAMLPPAHTMKVRQDATFEISRYWDLAEASTAWVPEVRELTARTAPHRLRELLEEATRLHMVSDVPVGAFLSGGIDSTAVVGLMSAASGDRIRTFSVGCVDDDSVPDERATARIVARRFDTDHSEVELRGRDVASQFDDIIRAVDQPSLDGTNTFIVSRAAGKSLKVALSGLGGDELFGGYPHFRRLQRAAHWDRWLGARPRSRRRAMAARVPGRLLADRELLVATPQERYAMLRLLASDGEKAGLLNPDLTSRIAATPAARHHERSLLGGVDPVAQTTYFETNGYLVDTLLRDVDAMSMWSSLEVRPVLLDHRVAELAFAMPATWKMSARGPNKPMLAEAVRDLLPDEVRQGRKTGFELPLRSWLTGPFRERALDAFTSPEARAVFSDAYLSFATAELTARRSIGIRAWSHLVLVEWLRMHRVAP